MFKEQFNEKEKVDLTSFISKVENYGSLSVALEHLPDDYIEFYLKNEKLIDKALKRRGINEDAQITNYGNPLTTRLIRYKNNLILLEKDNDLNVWKVRPIFKRLVDALKYGKSEIDEIVDL